MENDLSLLRPFDLDAAKAGESICTHSGIGARLLAHVPECAPPYRLVIHVSGDAYPSFHYAGSSALRMAPLAWAEGKPVYAGDRLRLANQPTEVTAVGRMANGSLRCRGLRRGIPSDTLTWLPYGEHAGAAPVAPLQLTEDEARRVYAVMWVAQQMGVTAKGLRVGECEVRDHYSGALDVVPRDLRRDEPVERYQTLEAFALAYGLPRGHAE